MIYIYIYIYRERERYTHNIHECITCRGRGCAHASRTPLSQSECSFRTSVRHQEDEVGSVNDTNDKTRPSPSPKTCRMQRRGAGASLWSPGWSKASNLILCFSRTAFLLFLSTNPWAPGGESTGPHRFGTSLL